MNTDHRDRILWIITAVTVLATLAGLTCDARADEVTPTPWERQAVETALPYCVRGTDPYMLLSILRLEEYALLPKHMRGIVLSTAIGEAACNPKAYNKRENAVGLMQLRERWWTCPGVEYDDPKGAVSCWLNRVVRLALSKAKRRCPRTRWTAAEAWTSQGQAHPKWPTNYFCLAETGHVKRLLRWQAKWKKAEPRGEG